MTILLQFLFLFLFFWHRRGVVFIYLFTCYVLSSLTSFRLLVIVYHRSNDYEKEIPRLLDAGLFQQLEDIPRATSAPPHLQDRLATVSTKTKQKTSFKNPPLPLSFYLFIYLISHLTENSGFLLLLLAPLFEIEIKSNSKSESKTVSVRHQ